MKKRFFVAIPLPEKLRENIFSYYETLTPLFKNKKIRFTKKENLHLTICFIGLVKEKLASRISKDLEKIIPYNSSHRL